MGRTDKSNSEEDEKLAEDVRKYLCLYDKAPEYYKNRRKVANAWKRADEQLGFWEDDTSK